MQWAYPSYWPGFVPRLAIIIGRPAVVPEYAHFELLVKFRNAVAVEGEPS
jgi:hypothetical protein